MGYGYCLKIKKFDGVEASKNRHTNCATAVLASICKNKVTIYNTTAASRHAIGIQQDRAGVIMQQTTAIVVNRSTTAAAIFLRA